MPDGRDRRILPNVNGNELLRRLGRLAKARQVEVTVDRRQGKGSHATLRFAGRKTTLKDLKKEIGPGLLRAMLNDIGLTPRDLDE
jgi:mRNA interferase HicA